MTEARAVVQSEVGLHARPAALFVEEAKRRQCSIEVEYRGRKANGKSIIQVLALGATHGAVIALKASGPDEEEAVFALVRILERKVE